MTERVVPVVQSIPHIFALLDLKSKPNIDLAFDEGDRFSLLVFDQKIKGRWELNQKR